MKWLFVVVGVVMLTACASHERLPECHGKAVPVNSPVPAAAAPMTKEAKK